MKTKIVYVIVSNKDHVYVEQLYISLVSLKIHSPNSSPSVVVDRSTEIVIKESSLDILSYIDDLIVVDVPSQYKGAACSRFLKTSLRQYISGPYLFVDTDTVIAEKLDDIDKLISQGVNIAAVTDGHCLFREMPNYHEIMERAHVIGWDNMVNDEIHFNSGVMFVADSGEAYDFYHKWHQNWLYEFDKGFYFDQLALARTNQDLNYVIKEIDGIWNFQLFWGALRFLHKSKIIHYGGYNVKESYYFGKKSVLEDLKAKGKLSEEGNYHIRNPKEAYIGLTKVVGQDDLNYFRSKLHDEYLWHPKRFELLESFVSFIQSLGKMKRKLLKEE